MFQTCTRNLIKGQRHKLPTKSHLKVTVGLKSLQTLTACIQFCTQQIEYAGLIERITSEDQDSEEENGGEQEPNKELASAVEYGITSLVDKKTVLQPGDKVCQSV